MRKRTPALSGISIGLPLRTAGVNFQVRTESIAGAMNSFRVAATTWTSETLPCASMRPISRTLPWMSFLSGSSG